MANIIQIEGIDPVPSPDAVALGNALLRCVALSDQAHALDGQIEKAIRSGTASTDVDDTLWHKVSAEALDERMALNEILELHGRTIAFAGLTEQYARRPKSSSPDPHVTDRMFLVVGDIRSIQHKTAMIHLGTPVGAVTVRYANLGRPDAASLLRPVTPAALIGIPPKEDDGQIQWNGNTLPFSSQSGFKAR